MHVVILHDGRVTTTDSEDWKWECLANFVLSLDFEERKPWIEEVRARAGDEAAQMLSARVEAIYKARKDKAITDLRSGHKDPPP